MTQTLPNIKTTEERKVYNVLHFDASHSNVDPNKKKIAIIEKEVRIISLSTIALILCDKWHEATKMIVEHKRNKEGHVAMRDYSDNKNAVNICKTMSARIAKFYDELYQLQDEINFHDRYKVEDPAEYWAKQTEVACKIFDKPLRKCLSAVYSTFRKSAKSDDPVMFSTIVKLVYLSGLFTNLLDSYAKHMLPEESKAFKRLDPAPLAFELSKKILLRNEEGKIFAFAYYLEESVIKNTLRTKKFYLGHKSEEFTLIYPRTVYQCDEILRESYELEIVLYDFKTISKIREQSGLEPIDYRKIFKMDRDVPCCTTYSQYLIGIMMSRYEYQRSLLLLDDFEKEIPLYHGRKTDPVVGFRVNLNRKPNEQAVTFMGIWNSCGEASRETGEKFITIASVKRANDRKANVEKGDWSMENSTIWTSVTIFRSLLEKLVEREYNQLNKK